MAIYSVKSLMLISFANDSPVCEMDKKNVVGFKNLKGLCVLQSGECPLTLGALFGDISSYISLTWCSTHC
jgi:hypothetical protein